MVMSIVGAVGSFDPFDTVGFIYIELLEEFFLVNEIKEEKKKVAISLSTVGSHTY